MIAFRTHVDNPPSKDAYLNHICKSAKTPPPILIFIFFFFAMEGNIHKSQRLGHGYFGDHYLANHRQIE